jgi:hypothetical protein
MKVSTKTTKEMKLERILKFLRVEARMNQPAREMKYNWGQDRGIAELSEFQAKRME